MVKTWQHCVVPPWREGERKENKKAFFFFCPLFSKKKTKVRNSIQQETKTLFFRVRAQSEMIVSMNVLIWPNGLEHGDGVRWWKLWVPEAGGAAVCWVSRTKSVIWWRHDITPTEQDRRASLTRNRLECKTCLFMWDFIGQILLCVPPASEPVQLLRGEVFPKGSPCSFSHKSDFKSTYSQYQLLIWTMFRLPNPQIASLFPHTKRTSFGFKDLVYIGPT